MIRIAHCTIQLLVLLRVHVVDDSLESDISSGMCLRMYLNNAVPVLLPNSAVIAAFQLVILYPSSQHRDRMTRS